VVKTSSTPVSAQQVRAQVGGTPLQARKALNRLIEDGRLSFKGKARATKYSPG
jgi:predicted ArsR family transcriptional regulator